MSRRIFRSFDPRYPLGRILLQIASRPHDKSACRASSSGETINKESGSHLAHFRGAPANQAIRLP